MIREYELIGPIFHPNFIVVRKPFCDNKDGSSGDSQNEWKGILRETQKGVKKQIDTLK
jgi:hypothetical protein